MITFSIIVIKGFKSIQDMTFDFNSKGINVIIGQNGAGKTTIFEALYWCLFGKTLKTGFTDSVQTLEAYKPVDYKGVFVKIDFTSGSNSYTICRSYNSTHVFDGIKTGNKLMVFENHINITEGSHKSNSQQFINDVLSCNDKTFLSCVLYGQRMKRLLEDDSQSKYEIFNQFFELDFIDALKIKADEFKKAYQEQHSNVEAAINKYDSIIQGKKQEEERYKQMLDSFELNKAAKIATLDERLQQLFDEHNKYRSEYTAMPVLLQIPDDTIEGLSENEKLLKANQSKLNTYSEQLLKINYELDIINGNYVNNNQQIKNTESFLEKDLTKCLSCGGLLNEEKQKQQLKDLDDKKQILKFDNDKLLEGLKTLQLDIQCFKQLSQEVLDDNTIIEKRLENIKNLYKQYEQRQAEKQRLELQIKNIKEQINIYKNLKQKEFEHEPPICNEDFQQTISLNESLKQKAIKKLDKLDYIIKIASFWSSKGFNNGGLKSYMINSMLNLLNLEVIKYSNQLNLSIKFSVKLEGNRKSFITQIYRDDVEICYEALSGGEKVRIDLSLCFGLFDLMAKVKQKFNIIAYDEAFEGLDEEGNYVIMEMLRQKALETNIFMITHNSNMDFYGCNHIIVAKENNKTLLI